MRKKTLDPASLDREGYCLLCREKKTNRCRGLCPKHYKRFHKEKNKLSEEDQILYEKRLISMGYLLEVKKRGRQVNESIFAEVRRHIKS